MGRLIGLFGVLAQVAILSLVACQSDGTSSGQDGEQGPPGEAGEQGPAGPALLTRTTTLSQQGDTCAYGGVQIDFGLDADGSGTLDDAEVDPAQTVQVCDGAPALQLLAVTSAADAADCPTGGVVVDYGYDEDDSGTLEVDELDPALHAVTCNGSPGPTGSSGLSGFQRVSSSYTVNNGVSAYYTAACPTGKTAISGGADINVVGGNIFASRGQGSQWTIGFENNTGLNNRTLTIYAYCAFVD